MGGWVSVKTRYFISSHLPKVRHLLATAKAHRGIATCLHWSWTWPSGRTCRICTGHAPRNLCLLRCMVLNLLRQDTTVKAG